MLRSYYDYDNIIIRQEILVHLFTERRQANSHRQKERALLLLLPLNINRLNNISLENE